MGEPIGDGPGGRSEYVRDYLGSAGSNPASLTDLSRRPIGQVFFKFVLQRMQVELHGKPSGDRVRIPLA